MARSTHQLQPVTRPSLQHRFALIGLIIAAAAMAACSTTEGFGKDVKNLGGDIEGSAAKNK